MDYWILSVICALLIYILIQSYRKVHEFSKWGIPQPPSLPLFGAILAMFFPRRHVNDFVRYVYDTDKDAKYVGAHVFHQPAIFIRDLELAKAVLVKNFDHFADRKTFVDERTDPLFGQNLNFLNGDRWREVRNMLSPTFTSSKMKSMHLLMSQCAENFTEQLIRIHGKTENLDMKNILSLYTNDVIASCAFGIEVDSLKNPDNEFVKHARKASMFSGVTLIKILLEMMFPALTRKLGMRIVSKEDTDFFVDVIETTMKTRDEKGIVRPDMLQIMMEARPKMTADTAAKFDLLEMTAQAFLFFLAGFEANSTQACLIAHELAVNPDIQNKVQDEIDSIMNANNGKPTYEAINNNMPYLDAVLSESLRRHPIAFLNRICSQEFVLPPALPGAKPYTVPQGYGIMIPVAGIHADPDYYPDPAKFDPERFIDKRIMTVDVKNLGFGMGPRMCIGNRFAILNLKVLFVHLLSKCSLAPCEKTCIPLKYDVNVFAPVAKGGFWLKLQPKNQ